MFIKDKILELETYLESLCKDKVFPGAYFTLVTNRDFYCSYLGYLQTLPKKERVRKESLYDLASLTKVIGTTTGALLLIEEGYLKLDSLVADILPKYSYKEVTIKDLLTHTSGHDPDIDWKGKKKEELIEAIYNSQINRKDLRRRIVYSDIGYILLGFIIEKITGSLERFLDERIFTPLGMKNTFFNPPKVYKDRCAATEYCTMRNRIVKGLVHDEKAYILGGVAGHAGLFSTGEDIAKFIQMYLNHGTYNGKQILKRETIDLTIKDYREDLNLKRGLGWIIQGEKTLYHTGFTGTSIIIDMEGKKGFVLLTNRVHPSRENKKLVPLRDKINNMALAAIK